MIQINNIGNFKVIFSDTTNFIEIYKKFKKEGKTGNFVLAPKSLDIPIFYTMLEGKNYVSPFEFEYGEIRKTINFKL